jgi:hypothetical protein
MITVTMSKVLLQTICNKMKCCSQHSILILLKNDYKKNVKKSSTLYALNNENITKNINNSKLFDEVH